MSISIAQTRQQLSAMIAAAQHAPQIITKHNAPVAVLVSAEFFNACAPILPPVKAHFYDRLQALRAQHMPTDDAGLQTDDKAKAAWQRNNPFADA
jgi:prevent-host-death family protein